MTAEQEFPRAVGLKAIDERLKLELIHYPKLFVAVLTGFTGAAIVVSGIALIRRLRSRDLQNQTTSARILKTR